MSSSVFSKIKRYIWDAVLIGVIAIASLGFMLFPNAFSKAGTTAKISSCNEVVLNVNLGISSNYKVDGKYSAVKVEVKNGAIRIVDNDCPSQFCIHEGWISKKGETIVCVYNQIVIVIEGGQGGADVIV